MPYVRSGSLADRLASGRPLERDEILRISRQIAAFFVLLAVTGGGVISPEPGWFLPPTHRSSTRSPGVVKSRNSRMVSGSIPSRAASAHW